MRLPTSITFAIFLTLTVFASAQEAEKAGEDDKKHAAFAAASASASKKELPKGQRGASGASADWLFHQKALAHLATGKFWEQDYAGNTVSGIDPAPIILDYHEKLKAIGVELLLVPIPPKAAIYPEKFTTEGEPAAVAPFYKPLTDAGVQVLDLEPIFRAERKKNPDRQLYCKVDSHYSPYAIQMISKLVHEKYKDSDWAKSIVSEIRFKIENEKTITIGSDIKPGASEKIPAVEVTDEDGEQVEPFNAGSPIILIGDSHTAVFSTGGSDMHAVNCGLPDHLQAKFGLAIDQVSNNASGTHTARINLLRRSLAVPEYWDGKKLLIWVFTARDLTQAAKWKKLPAQAP